MAKQASIEGRVRDRAKRAHIQNIVLTTLYSATALGTVAIAPGAAQFLKPLVERLEKKNLKKRMDQAIVRLKKNGLIVLERTKDGARLRLTQKGLKATESMLMYEAPPKPKRWDRKWRIVIFDIWEKRRTARDNLRRVLQRIGFKKIQDSVWVYPYDCEELFVLLRAELKLGRGMLYIVAEEIEGDTHLRQHFKLPLA